MKRGATIAIVVAVFVAATLVGIAPYTYSSALQSQKPLTFTEQISAQIASETQNPVVEIQNGASKTGTVLQPFSPSIVNVHLGSKVTWINKDSSAHTVTSPIFDSGPISPANNAKNSSSFSYTFNQSGIFNYYCKIHPYMGGTIYVDTTETQRQLVSTTNPSIADVKVELPQNAAYQNKFGPYFIPANAIVLAGTRVTWTNHDFIAHTATSGDNGSSFNTGPILPGSSKTLIIKHPGVMSYFCEFHPWMTGTVTALDSKT